MYTGDILLYTYKKYVIKLLFCYYGGGESQPTRENFSALTVLVTCKGPSLAEATHSGAAAAKRLWDL